MMKNSALLTITFAMLAFCRLGRAQDQEPTIDSKIAVVRANMQADRTTLITAGMNFNDKDGAAFWPIYQQYEYERSRLDDGRVAVIKEYTQKYPTLTDTEANAMAERMFEYDARIIALKKKYFKKFIKALPALTVAKFFARVCIGRWQDGSRTFGGTVHSDHSSARLERECWNRLS
ncbi:MAG: hypothetical protein LAO09_09580 [Acidobacteriia bacterium]|nr:hypothetical protein [Terriglobia bacterium]